MTYGAQTITGDQEPDYSSRLRQKFAILNNSRSGEEVNIFVRNSSRSRSAQRSTVITSHVKFFKSKIGV